MLLLYIVTVLLYCYALDALSETVSRRSFRARMRELRAQVRANLATRGTQHV